MYVGHELVKSFEQVATVVWSRPRFGVVLHAECRHIKAADSFDCLVVEIDMRDLDTVYQVVGHAEVVILAGDLHGALGQVTHGMIATVMPKRQLEGR